MNDTLSHGNENLQLNIRSDEKNNEKSDIKQLEETKTKESISNINSKRPHDIFDRIFKRIITLSSATIVRFINGIFDADYPIDSTVTYNWTENVDDKLKKTIADTIITINGTDSFHLEAQMYKDDESILLRVFDYGYNHSKRHPEDIFDESGVRCGVKLKFPEQIVIYLDSSENIPDEYLITLVVNDKQEFSFKIPTIKFQNESLQDIINKHMIILLPFKLLKVRDRFKRAYEDVVKTQDSTSAINNTSLQETAENRLHEVIQELRDIYQRDIISSIEDSYKNGDITRRDMTSLTNLTNQMFDHLYSKYSNIQEVNTMLYDQSLDLVVDKYEDKIEEMEAKLAEKEKVLAEKDEEILRLQKELNQLKKA